MSIFSTSLYVFDVQTARKQATFENAIALDKKYCWCCDRLGTLLGNVQNGLAHMEFSFILGVLIEWERMLLFSDLLRVFCGTK